MSNAWTYYCDVNTCISSAQGVACLQWSTRPQTTKAVLNHVLQTSQI